MDVSIDKVAKALETPAYVAVGFGVLGFQRAQVRRRELQRHMAGAANTVNQLLGEVSGEVAERLPREARDLLKAAGDVAHDLPREAEEMAKEVVALGRLVLGSVRGSGNGRPLR